MRARPHPIAIAALDPEAPSSSFTSPIPDWLYGMRHLLPFSRHHECTVTLLFLMQTLLRTAIRTQTVSRKF
jgi:hypothetical protein